MSIQIGQLSISLPNNLLPSVPLEGLLALLAVSHLLYAVVWFFPGVVVAALPRHTVDRFATIAGVIKAAQITYMFGWLFHTMPKDRALPPIYQDLPAWIRSIHPIQFALFAALFAAGQSLNAGIYRAIGHQGVYYGSKLGVKVPWVTGFPFNVCPHPQYVGSVLTIWAFYALFCFHSHPGLLPVALYWTGLYALTAWFEDLDVDNL